MLVAVAAVVAQRNGGVVRIEIVSVVGIVGKSTFWAAARCETGLTCKFMRPPRRHVRRGVRSGAVGCLERAQRRSRAEAQAQRMLLCDATREQGRSAH